MCKKEKYNGAIYNRSKIVLPGIDQENNDFDSDRFIFPDDADDRDPFLSI